MRARIEEDEIAPGTTRAKLMIDDVQVTWVSDSGGKQILRDIAAAINRDHARESSRDLIDVHAGDTLVFKGLASEPGASQVVEVRGISLTGRVAFAYMEDGKPTGIGDCPLTDMLAMLDAGIWERRN